jgi:hypothetical protein
VDATLRMYASVMKANKARRWPPPTEITASLVLHVLAAAAIAGALLALLIRHH